MATYISSLEDLDNLYNDYSKENGLPRIIHQTYKDEHLPSHWLISRDNWLRYHPQWLYVLWTDEMLFELVNRYYPDFKEKFDSYPYFIQKVDAARVFMLHRYGGIYSDLDLAPQRSLEDLSWDNLREEVYLLSNQGRFTNMFMMSQQKAPFWNKVIEEMRKPKIPWYLGVSRHFYILTTTGPFVIDRVANNYHKPIGFLPSSQFQPCSNCDPKPCQTENSYLVMLDGGSWGSWDSQIIGGCCCHWDKLILIGIIIIVIVAILIYIYFY